MESGNDEEQVDADQLNATGEEKNGRSIPAPVMKNAVSNTSIERPQEISSTDFHAGGEMNQQPFQPSAPTFHHHPMVPPLQPQAPPLSVPLPAPVHIPGMPLPVPPSAYFADNLMQLQYYEARMREHAAQYAQYASAAAGAALAAAQSAQMASAGAYYPHNLPTPAFYPQQQQSQQPQHFAPIPSPVGVSAPNNDVQQMHTSMSQGPMNEKLGERRSLYNPNTPASHHLSNSNDRAKKQKRSVPNYNSNPSSSAPANSCTAHTQSQNFVAAKFNRRTRRRRETNVKDDYNYPSTSSRDRDNQHRNAGRKTKRYLSNGQNIIKSSDLMGKTGVSAIYDLCNKRHWSSPKFIEIESPLMTTKRSNIHTDDSSSSTIHTHSISYNNVDFIMVVEVNGVELSRGRGGSKKSAQQDAARRALQLLYPETTFDPNGILVELGRNDKSSTIFGWNGNGDGPAQKHKVRKQGSHCALEELVPNLASRLAIDGNQSSDRLSPVPSEDSSISTTVSMAKGKPISVVVGGPFIKTRERARNRLAFPSASTTSGVSSASEDVDDDEYLATRGASVCSALLNVMVQIDARIKDSPVYTFDVCANPATIAANQQNPHNEQGQDHLGARKRGSSGAGGAIVSKRRSATNAVGKIVTIHRNSFACTASLTLHKNVIKKDCSKEQQGVAKVDIGVTLKESESRRNESIRKSPQTHKSISDKGSHDNARGGASDTVEGIELQKIQAVGTGASKREARHVASAKILAMLFPECQGMVEVKSAAESARERYAANKALKRSSNASGGKRHQKRERRRKTKNDTISMDSSLSLLFPKSGDPPIPDKLSKQFVDFVSMLEALRMSPDCKRARSPPNRTSESLAKLSLSESISEVPGEDKKKEATNSETSADRLISRQKQFEEMVNHALQSLDADDERKISTGYIKENDLSKTILRRASEDDVSSIERLLSKGGSKRSSQLKNTMSSIGPLSLIGLSLKTTGVYGNLDFDISTEASQLWGSKSVVLILSRAIALPDEPPLGCAVLTLGFSISRGRLLRIHDIAHEKHFPKERFVEILEDLAHKMKCSIDSTSNLKNPPKSLFLNEESLVEITRQYMNPPQGDNQETRSEGHSINRKPLQSVKEEDNEDDNSKSTHVHHKRLKVG